MLDERAKVLLKTLVERYIADGQPVGSRTLSKETGLTLSPATIRNVMSDLEDLGLITSPHTSAGRVPTPKGYRLFVDTMLTLPSDDYSEWSELSEAERLAGDQPSRVLSHAAQMISSLSQFVGVVVVPKGNVVFRHIEFLSLSERRILVIIVTPDGDVQNRVMHPNTDYSQAQLTEAANFLNAHYSGLTLDAVRARLKSEVETLRSEIVELMTAAVGEADDDSGDQADVVIAGERNLLLVNEFSADLNNLRRMFDLFEQKTQVMRLLDGSGQADGVRIFIGGESRVVPVEDVSIVSAPYEVDGRVVGRLGVIGPQRMAYDRMIRIVSLTSRMLGNALSHNR
jgi:heat-inducible transcriptional repressor